MARPKKENRDEVRGAIITLKVTKPERERLKKLIAAREAEIEKLTGEHFDVSISGYVRWLIDRDAKARGLKREATESPLRSRRRVSS
jgi:hypothetical protein